MGRKELETRTKNFVLRIIKLVENLPTAVVGKNIANQLVRSGMSVGANYRASCRGRSKAEFIAKLGVVLEETDECVYWLEIIMESGLLPKKKVLELHKEADELAAIFYTILKSSKQRLITN